MAQGTALRTASVTGQRRSREEIRPARIGSPAEFGATIAIPFFRPRLGDLDLGSGSRNRRWGRR